MSGRQYEVEFRLAGDIESSFHRTFTTASDDFKKLYKQAEKLQRGPTNSNLTKSVRDDLKKTQAEIWNTESSVNRMSGVFKKAIIPLTAGLGIGTVAFDSLKKSMDFEAQLDSIQAVSGLSQGEMKKVHDLALDLGAKTKYSALEAAQGMEEMIKAGLTTKQVINGGLEAALNLAAAGEIGLADSAEIMSTALNAFKKDALDASEVADILAGSANASATGVMELKMSLSQASAVASGVGMSFKDTNAALGVFANNGLKGSDAGTSLKTMLLNLSPTTADATAEFERLGLMTFNSTKALEFLESQGIKPATKSTKGIVDAMMTYAAKSARAKVGSDKANKAFREMAFNAGAMSSEFYDANGNLQSLEHIAGSLKKALSSLTSEQRQVALKTMFGTDAIRAANILYEEGAEGVKNFNEEMSKVTALDVAKKRMDNAKGAVEQFKGAMETLQISVLEPTLPLIKDLALSAADASEKFQAWMNTREAKVWGNILLSTLKAAPKLILTAGAATAAFKTGKGIVNVVNFSKGLMGVQAAGKSAAAGMSVASKTTRLFGTAAAMLTNPVGLAVAGVGALTAGVIAYKRHQEKARQELIHMGDALKTALGDYSAVETQTAETQKLTKEYDRLKQKIYDSKTPTNELAEAKRKLSEVETDLMQMYPELISQHDIENGKLEDKLDLVKRLSAAQLEEQRLKLERTVLEKSGQEEDLKKEILNLRSDKTKAISDKDKYSQAMVTFAEIENEYKALLSSGLGESSVEYKSKFDEIMKRANEAGKPIGKSFYNESFAVMQEVTKSIRDKALDAYDAIEKSTEELKSAESSYQELYDAQKRIIEINLGGTLDEQAKKYKSMTDAQKRQFDEALNKLTSLNKEMNLLPTDKKINLDVVYKEIGKPQPPKSKPSDFIPEPFRFKPPKLPGFADGGFSNTPAIFGEAGLEAAIPINNKPRSHAILDRVNQMMGRTSHPKKNVLASTNNPTGIGRSEAPAISVKIEPSTIVIQGNADDVTAKQLEQILQDNNAKLAGMIPRLIEDYYKQRARVSMNGV